MAHSIDNHHQFKLKPIVILVTIGTTFFFVVKCYQEVKNTEGFYEAMKGKTWPGENSWPMILNLLANKYLAYIIPFFNIYFMLQSQNGLDAILNGLALLFILELDQMAVPDYSAAETLDLVATNFHDYVMEEPLDRGEIVVEYHGQCAAPTFSDDDKLYFRLSRDENGWCSPLVIYKRKDSTHYENYTYYIRGNRGQDFADAISKFKCYQSYEDIHD